MTARVIPFPRSRVAAGTSSTASSSIDWDASFVVLGILHTADELLRANRRLILRESPDGAWELSVSHPDCTVETCIRGDAASLACDLLAALQWAIFDQGARAERNADEGEG